MVVKYDWGLGGGQLSEMSVKQGIIFITLNTWYVNR